MRLVYLTGILLVILFGTFLNWILCCEARSESAIDAKEPVAVEAESPVIGSFFIKDSAGDFSFESEDNFKFKESNFFIVRPVPESVNQGVGELKSYLENGDNRFIDVTGYYDAGEGNNSAFPNLGLARANSVKNYLITQGLSSKKINTYGVLETDLPKKDSIYLGPLSFSLSDKLSSSDDVADIVERIKEEPIVLYFDSGRSTINFTEAQRKQYMDIVRAMDISDETTVMITGHADNIGDYFANKELGKRRAEFVKSYLVENGIPEGKIETASKGSIEPIADNNTAEGRAKNRRIVITLK
ncbi:OmpA family protein [Galbibacter sp. EGI 63066]|uniref:OmpA family protein n=1 Tax=Galbibacter sp. EGI 63066 TaxID=2993559 RepID=UPI0022496DE7|nr:OmpA family protein [Galbibacter sp. EGI 63066]MCX2680609.1 OmpA family protein [Galbibacter sp. EGI 63066]